MSPPERHGYSAERVQQFFDEYGQAEIDRHQRSSASRVSLEIHRRFLHHWIRKGDRVLEVGAGPGVFTIELARLGARVTVTDISPRQLQLNAERLTRAGLEAAIERREQTDIVDLSRFPPSSFDAAVAYGGPLSYVFDQAGRALDELLRTVRPRGVALLSVMSLWGSVHQFLDGILQDVRAGFRDDYDRLLSSGDQVGRVAQSTGLRLPHEMHLFSWSELKALIESRPCRLVDVSSANFLSIRANEPLGELNQQQWEQFLEWEQQASKAEGALDAGTHIIAALERA